ncbi:conjugal transfer protein MobC [Flavobacterium sp. RHBU_24]|uniref:conjugal transfer protein MobC n=1 Tax=Flavobacterium sp. RHBU_24 TaxID=3391185 RepID=UPI003984FE4A
MNTGENEQALRKILDMTRLISLTVLFLHFYYEFHRVFELFGFTTALTDNILSNIIKTGLLSSFAKPKWIALLFLLISLMGAKGRKDEKLNLKTAMRGFAVGFILFVTSGLVVKLFSEMLICFFAYLAVTAIGYLLMLSAGTKLSRLITRKLDGKDIFNKINETFPQEERRLDNEYSINLPARYHLKDKVRRSWVNIINPFRGLMVLGTPGAGKSYFVIRHVITQHIAKGFTMFVYDFKFDDLSRIAYNSWLKHKDSYPVPPKFYTICFDDLSRSHRCNPLDPSSMTDITDAAESARTILMGLNREWIKKQGDFFVESPINFLTAVIWYLRKYKDGRFCTLPHVIELMQVEYDSLFTLLRTEKEIEVLINPFVTAYLNDVMEQLEGQVASAKIALARLSSPQLYYVLSGNDFTLDINNPSDPKIVCMGNNPQKIQIYGAVLSLFVTRLVKQVNRKGMQKSSLIFDEFPTIYLNNMDSLIATARSNKVATCLGIQDFSQLRKDYGREQAEVIMNITGNIVAGQVTGDTAKQLSERFGKIMQDRESLSINSNDTSISRSKQLESAIPPSKITALSSGEFVGMVADEPENKIDLKAFHCEIQNNHEALRKEEAGYREIEAVRKIDNGIIIRNYEQVKQDVQEIIQSEIEMLLADPAKAGMVIRK